ncbi:MAG: hypothetical protein DRG27_04775 [Deltaproteobacteria bacterium]|nr:MAG: hypothetical protein DRG27_04775 [Deltaproteobacteria bacterium]
MEEIQTTSQDFSKIKQIILRRKWWLIIPFFTITSLSILIAFLLPNMYESSAIILIKSRQVPKDLIPSTVTSYADQRIQAITQEIMSRSRIMELVKKYDLLPDKRNKLTVDQIVQEIINRIHVEPITAEIHSGTPYGRPTVLTIAFKVSYQDENPKKAQLVTNEIASFYLEKNLESVKERAKETTRFLEEQLKEVKNQIKELENKIAEYRKKHLEELPEFSALNMQKLEKLNSELSNINMQLRSLEEQKVVLENKLALLDPYAGGGQRILSPEERLQQARLELSELLSRYSEKHPLVLAKKKEVALLEKQVKGIRNLTELNSKLHELELKLSELKARYSDKHPAVKSVKRQIEELKSQIAKFKNQIGYEKEQLQDATNPAYIQIKSDLDKIKVSISSLKAEKARIEKQIKEIYKKLRAMPEVAKKYNELQLDYENAKAHYNELQKKLMVAKVAENLQEDQLGEKFEVIEPAFLPEEPCKPNRTAICLIGFVLAVGASVGCASVAEYMDKKVYEPEMVEKLTQSQVLAAIPRIYSEKERKKAKKKRLLILLAIIIVIVVAILIFHFFVMDLWVFWAKLNRFIQSRI